MIIEQSQHIIDEVSKVFIGKDEIIKKVLMTIYAGGHILLNDAPGFRVIIVTVANSLGNIKVFELLPKLKTKKYGWCIA